LTSEVQKMYKRLSGARRHAEHLKVFNLLCSWYPQKHGLTGTNPVKVGWVDDQYVLFINRRVVAYGTLAYMVALSLNNKFLNEEGRLFQKKSSGASSTVAP